MISQVQSQMRLQVIYRNFDYKPFYLQKGLTELIGLEANKNKEPVELATYVRQMLEMNTSLKAKVAECPSLADEIVNTIVSKSENM